MSCTSQYLESLPTPLKYVGYYMPEIMYQNEQQKLFCYIVPSN